jgi:hypothetical protein
MAYQWGLRHGRAERLETSPGKDAAGHGKEDSGHGEG